MNRIELIGILGNDPELGYNEKGRPVCKFSLATESKRAKNIRQDLHTILIWGPRAEELPLQICKASRVMITGRLGIQRWEYAGKTHTKTIVVAESVKVLTRFPLNSQRKIPANNTLFPNSIEQETTNKCEKV